MVVNGESSCAIIDPGCYSEQERKELVDFIESNGLNPKYLLNTHCHLDHVFGNQFVAQRYGLPLHLHRMEETMLEYAPLTGDSWGMPFENYSGELVFLEEKEELRLGEEVLQVLFTPGHSPGSISFYHPGGQFVIAGDVLFRESIGRTDLPGGDFETLAHSIRSRLFSLPDEVTVYAGHGGPTTIGHEKKHNPFIGEAAR